MTTQLMYDDGRSVIGDAERAAGLTKMKRLATGMLVLMVVIFIVAFALQEQYPWLQYVRAAAEGGMVGALADWFAVTALFKHPMGLKIPHTAIIPRKKDQIGASLGSFVEENFLSEEVVKAKIASLGVSAKTGAWLARPENADRVAREGATAIRAAMLVLNDEDVQDVIESMARRHLLDPEWGPPLGKLAKRLLDDGHHLKLVELLLDRVADWVLDNQETVARLVADRSPTWVPSFVDSLMGDKVHLELYKFIAAVQADPEHQVRQQLDVYLQSLAQDLQTDPDMIARVENLKKNALGDPEVRQLAVRTWDTLKRALLEKMPGDEWQKFANLRALLAYQWTRPGKKLLFMGAEIAQPKEWNHDASLDWHQANTPLAQGVQHGHHDVSRVDLEMAAQRRASPIVCSSTGSD